MSNIFYQRAYLLYSICLIFSTTPSYGLMPDSHEIQVGPPVQFFQDTTDTRNSNEYALTSLTANTIVIAYNKANSDSAALRFGYRPPHSDRLHFFDEHQFSNEAVQ